MVYLHYLPRNMGAARRYLPSQPLSSTISPTAASDAPIKARSARNFTKWHRLLLFGISSLLLYRMMFDGMKTPKNSLAQESSALLWELDRYSQLATATTTNTLWLNSSSSSESVSSSVQRKAGSPRKSLSRNLLISQYVGPGPYSTLLNMTMPVTRAYAKLYQYDYALCRGLYFPQLGGLLWHLEPRPSRATYNKLAILEYAIQHKYDYVLIMDADAMIFGFGYDILEELPIDNYMLIAHRTGSGSINIGVTLWNVSNPMTIKVFQRWKAQSLRAIRVSFSQDNDQGPLRNVLKGVGESFNQHVLLVDGELGYGGSRLTRHFIRPNRKWDVGAIAIDSRLDSARSSISEICQRYPTIRNVCV